MSKDLNQFLTVQQNCKTDGLEGGQDYEVRVWEEGEMNVWTFTQSLLSEHHIERFALSLLRKEAGVKKTVIPAEVN